MKDLTGMTEAERRAVLKASEAEWVLEDGTTMRALPGSSRTKPLTAVAPRPTGGGLFDPYEKLDGWSDYVRRVVALEVGRGDLTDEEHREAAEVIAREKGWLLSWDGTEPEDPAPLEPAQPVKRKRGRPKGSKDKKPRRRKRSARRG